MKASTPVEIFNLRAHAIANLFGTLGEVNNNRGKEQEVFEEVVEADNKILELSNLDQNRKWVLESIRKVQEEVTVVQKKRTQLCEQLRAIDSRIDSAVFDAKRLLASQNTKHKIVPKDAIPYARRVTYTTGAPPGWRHGVDVIPYPFKTPTPQVEDLKAGLLFTDPEELLKLALEKKKSGKPVLSKSVLVTTAFDAGIPIDIKVPQGFPPAIILKTKDLAEDEDEDLNGPPLKKHRTVVSEPDMNTEERKILKGTPTSTQPQNTNSAKKERYNFNIFESESGSEDDEET
jgi:hypothetical protein